MFIPGYGQQPAPSNTEHIRLNEHEFLVVLDDSVAVQKSIRKANGAFAAMANVLKEKELNKTQTQNM
eukprot:scaffold2253_cov119-Cylindrotheca_fusiformis.AAC.11